MEPKNRHQPSLRGILALAARQHGLVTRAQLRDAGLSAQAIKHRLRTGRIHRIQHSVFSVGRPDLSTEEEWLAAVLACGEGAAVSHLSAGSLWRIWTGANPRWPQVSVPTTAGRRGPRGVDVHRTRTLTRDQVTQRNAIPVTTLERTLVDLAATLNRKRLRSALRQAERIHDLDLKRLRSSLDARPPTACGPARLKRALDVYVPGTGQTEGEPEADFLALCERHNIPLPETQVAIGRHRADFLWRDLNLVVEIDDRGSHDGYVAFREDRVKDRALKAAGFEVIRFTTGEVAYESTKVARESRTARARRAAA